MKKVIFTIVSLLITSQTAYAANNCSRSSPADRACRREFAHDLIKCVVTSFYLRPKLRADNLKTCVVAAKSEKTQCLNHGGTDPNQCANACQATYDSNISYCQTTYNLVSCNGDANCESALQQQRASCISSAVDNLNACSSACPQN